MKKPKISYRKRLLLVGLPVIVLGLLAGGLMYANENDSKDTMKEGVFIGGIDVSGMTREEAQEEVERFIQRIRESTVTFIVDTNEVEVKAEELGFSYNAAEEVEEAFSIARSGNVVKRYKETKELKKGGKSIPLDYGFNEDTVKDILEKKCTTHDIKPVNGMLQKTEGGFQITEGKAGYGLDIEASLKTAMNFLNQEWQGGTARIPLESKEIQPKGTKEELSKVKDLMGAATTSFRTSSANRSKNVQHGAQFINGTLLYPGEQFSAFEKVNPVTESNGYFMAPSYEKGKVVESAGGGICQVSTTLYNAVLKAELEVTERSNHSMTVAYVDPAMDAAIAGTYKDLKFINNTEHPIYIESIVVNKQLTFNIYGVETRSPNRRVEYKSEIVSEIPATAVISSSNMNFGTMSTTQTAHAGLVAKLWKIVYENDVEVSRTEVNKSNYSMSPKHISVGTANASEEALSELNAAIAANNEAAVRQVISRYGTVKTSDTAPIDEDSIPDTTQANTIPNTPSETQKPDSQTPAPQTPAPQTPNPQTPNPPPTEPASQQPTTEEPTEE